MANKTAHWVLIQLVKSAVDHLKNESEYNIAN